MRLFVAIALPAGAATELDAVLAPLRADWPGLRWTGRDAWHLTLAFLGEVDEALTAGLGTRLERAANRHSRLTLSLAGAGAFPWAGRARVLWSGVQGDGAGLAALAGSVTAAARRAGIPVTATGRRYQPHLTLARCRAPVDVRWLVDQLAGYDGPSWEAGEIYLIRSYLGTAPGSQPRYEALGNWPLRPPRAARSHTRPAPGASLGPGRWRNGGPAPGGPGEPGH